MEALRGRKVTIWSGTWNVGAKEPFEGERGPRILTELETFVMPGYDVYILGVQEGVSNSLFHRVEALTKCKRLVLPETHDRVIGRGDGSFVSPKFTGIAVFVSDSVRHMVKLLSVQCHSFGKTEGSKGGAGVALGIGNTTLAAISCHLASKKPLIRLAQFKELCKVLGAKLGNEFFQLTESFHHVIWLGDLNYRCSDVTPSEALAMIRGGREGLQMLLQNHDELTLQRKSHSVFHNFVEPAMGATFFPTYKKNEGHGVPDRSSPDWVSAVYHTQFKEPLYKGGRTKTRIPGWCDRVLYHSMRDVAGLLVPQSAGDGYLYYTVTDSLTVSDHAPVFAGFDLFVHADVGAPARPASMSVSVAALSAMMSPMRHDSSTSLVTDTDLDGVGSASPALLMLQVSDVLVEAKSAMLVPKLVKLLFPAPYEAGAMASSTPLRLPRTKLGIQGTVKVTQSNALAIPFMHLIMKVSTPEKGAKGHCVIPIYSLVSSMVDDPLGASVACKTYLEPLVCDGVPVLQDGRQVHVQFTITAQGHVKAAAPEPLP